MSEFKEAPAKELLGMEAVRSALGEDRNAPFGLKYPQKYQIKSDWIISLIAEIQASGKYAYNADIKRLAMDRLGFPRKTDREYAEEGQDCLSLLIYCAQGYKRSDDLKAEGFAPFTQAMLQEAYDQGKAIEIQGENMLGGDVLAGLRVKKIEGKLYAMKPNKRKYHIAPAGQPARLIAAPHASKLKPGPQGVTVTVTEVGLFAHSEEWTATYMESLKIGRSEAAARARADAASPVG